MQLQPLPGFEHLQTHLSKEAAVYPSQSPAPASEEDTGGLGGLDWLRTPTRAQQAKANAQPLDPANSPRLRERMAREAEKAKQQPANNPVASQLPGEGGLQLNSAIGGGSLLDSYEQQTAGMRTEGEPLAPEAPVASPKVGTGGVLSDAYRAIAGKIGNAVTAGGELVNRTQRAQAAFNAPAGADVSATTTSGTADTPVTQPSAQQPGMAEQRQSFLKELPEDMSLADKNIAWEKEIGRKADERRAANAPPTADDLNKAWAARSGKPDPNAPPTADDLNKAWASRSGSTENNGVTGEQSANVPPTPDALHEAALAEGDQRRASPENASDMVYSPDQRRYIPAATAFSSEQTPNNVPTPDALHAAALAEGAKRIAAGTPPAQANAAAPTNTKTGAQAPAPTQPKPVNKEPWKQTVKTLDDGRFETPDGKRHDNINLANSHAKFVYGVQRAHGDAQHKLDVQNQGYKNEQTQAIRDATGNQNYGREPEESTSNGLVSHNLVPGGKGGYVNVGTSQFVTANGGGGWVQSKQKVNAKDAASTLADNVNTARLDNQRIGNINVANAKDATKMLNSDGIQTESQVAEAAKAAAAKADAAAKAEAAKNAPGTNPAPETTPVPPDTKTTPKPLDTTTPTINDLKNPAQAK
jgi:hypothetical protein